MIVPFMALDRLKCTSLYQEHGLKKDPMSTETGITTIKDLVSVSLPTELDLQWGFHITILLHHKQGLQRYTILMSLSTTGLNWEVRYTVNPLMIIRALVSV